MKKRKKARDQLPHHIPGYPREHYNIDRTAKMQYKTKESAENVVKMWAERGNYGIEAYQCSICGCWHVGHSRLLPVQQRLILQDVRNNNNLLMLEHYKDDLRHVQTELDAIMSKIGQLEKKMRIEIQIQKLEKETQQ